MKSASFFPICAVLLWAGGLIPSVAQTPAPTAQPTQGSDKPYVRISESGWGPNGELVLAVRLHAGKSEFLLGSFGKPERGNTSGIGSPKAFTLAGSTLEDVQSGKKFSPLETLIKKPYFGPTGTVLKLGANGWVQLGVAFPHPPSPGKNKDGQMNPYTLRYYPPDGLDPVEVQIPFDKSAEAAANKAVPR